MIRERAGGMPSGEPPPEVPVRVCDVELTEPVTDLFSGHDAARVRVLGRVHGEPVGMVEMARTADTAACRTELWRVLGAVVNRHLLRDGWAPVDALPARGCADGGRTPCHVAVRRRSQRVVPISVVVATRDRTDTLARCLDSVLGGDHPDTEIVVVDNAPSDSRSAELVSTRYRGRVRYELEPVPGLANAHNRGLRSASGEVVAFTDDDVVADRGWLAAVADAFLTEPGVDAVTGLIMPAELETTAQLLLERHGGYTKGFERRTFDLGAARPSDPLFPFTVGQVGSGANMAFSTAVLRDVGGFDPALGAGTRARGGDDLSGLFTVLAAGHRIVYEPAALVWHAHARSDDALRRQARGYGTGLGAYLTSALLHRPDLVPHALRNAGGAVHHAFAGGNERNRRRYSGWPASLARAERVGIMTGPIAYGLSRLDQRRARGGTS
jgi:glycosyltransferase involved in cell wall biosynthesis